MKNEDDDDDQEYFDYTPSTIDPGHWLTIGVILFSVSCILLLPFIVWLMKQNRRHKKVLSYECLIEPKNDDPSEFSGAKRVDDGSPIASKEKNCELEPSLERENKEWSEESGDRDIISKDCDIEPSVKTKKGQSCQESRENTKQEDVENSTDPKGDTISTSSEKSLSRLDKLLEIAKHDKESKRMLSIALPIALTEVSESVTITFTVIIISHYQGTDALTAYLLVEMLLDLTDTLAGGIVESLDTLCSHAIGNDNYRLAGQYIQIALVIYVISGGIFFGVWIFIMEDIVRLLGVSDDVVRLCQEFTKIMVFVYLQNGISEIWGNFLYVIDHEKFQAFIDVTGDLTSVFAIWVLYAKYKSFDLFWVGVTQLVISFLFMIIALGVAIYKRWFSLYYEAIFCTNALKNKVALYNVVKTSIPIGVGTLLEYGEWEVLVFVASYMGPAEVAAWVILGDLWDTLESATQGLVDAASIRVAKHLGKGNPNAAKIVAYKALFLGVLLGTFTSTTLLILWHAIPGWYTSDPMLQEMVMDAIPLMALGNMLMVFGMISWDLVGAQGRYKLATGVSLVSSWFVTIPLALFFTIYCKLNLMGIVASVVVGYSISGLMQACILLSSNWSLISKKIQEKNAEEGEFDSSSSSSDSSSSSSDSSSPSSDSSSSSSDLSSSNSGISSSDRLEHADQQREISRKV